MRTFRPLAAATGLALATAALAVTGATAHATTSAIPADGLIASYDFSETSGSTLADSATADGSQDGTVVGTPSWTAGVMDFTGSDHVKLPDGLLSGQTAASITVEARPDAASLSHNNFLWNLGGSGNDKTGQFFVQTNGHRASISKTNYSAERTALAPTGFAAGAWQSITTTIAPNADGTTSTLTLYVDGTQVAQNASSDTGVADLATQTKNLIGASAYTADADFTGAISSYRLYDRALTADEVATVADADAATAAQEAVAGLDLGDLSGLASDLTLPSAGGITWETSDASVIEADGTIHPTDEARSATLTATATVDGHTATRTFDVTVAKAPTAQEKAEQDLAAISIPNADDVRGDLTLPTTGSVHGSAITWTASPAGIVSTSEHDGLAPGVVTRPARDTAVTLTASVAGTTATRSIPLTVIAAPQAADTSAYLFAHFTDGLSPSTVNEQIYFASSADGKTWTDLNDQTPVLTSTVGEQGARDPYLVRSPDGDHFYLIATDLSTARYGWRYTPSNPGSTSLVVWESDDLVHWSQPRLADVASKIPGAGCAWAPEAMWDPATGQYMVYWASTTGGGASDPLGNANGDDMNMYYATTRDFVTFSAPHKWIDRTKSVIDTTMIKAGDWYYRASGDGDITLERSQNPFASTGDAQTTGDPDQWSKVGTLQSVFGNAGYSGSYLEGPELFQYNKEDWLTDDSGNPVPTWGLMADQYSAGKGYLPFRTTDLSSTTSTANGGAWSLGSDIDLGGLKKRHGTILPISQNEYDGVEQSYGDDSVTVASLAVTQAPTTTALHLGDSLDTDGLEVTATTAEGSTRVLEAGEYVLSGFDPDTLGTQQVTVAYAAAPSITTSFDVTVTAAPKVASRLTLKASPTTLRLDRHHRARFVVSGKVSASVHPTGRVAVTVAGVTHRVKVSGTGTFRIAVTVKKAKRYRITARYLGSSTVKPSSTRTVHVVVKKRK